MPFLRSSGILLHPTSFPSRFGIGDLGEQAYQFIDFLAESNQQYWQILPLGPYGDAPYMSYGAMAGNPMLISLEQLQQDGLLSDADLAYIPDFPVDRVDFAKVLKTKLPLLEKACETFKVVANWKEKQEFLEFCESKAYWLDDYALFMSFRDLFEGACWYDWKPSLVKHPLREASRREGIAQRDPVVMEQWRRRLAAEIFLHKFLQFEFFRQWSKLKEYANDRHIQIIGDIPIYVSHNSVDVWANQDIFYLDKDTYQPSLMAGVPPDYFSPTGQLWGNPVCNWERLQQEDFRWWVERFQAMLDYVDLIRIDHFRGFEAYWVVPQGETSAINGKWVEAPGEAFFKRLEQKLGKLPIMAEDLGVITPEVEALRDKFEFPGMKILQFAFGSGSDNAYLPLNYPRNCVVYTGTHDNDTTVGWFEKLSAQEQAEIRQYLGCTSADGIHWDLIRLAFSSVANQAIIPLQDVLGLGSEGRMNRPSQIEGNWAWRYRPEVLTEEVRDRLKMITQTYGRAPVKT